MNEPSDGAWGPLRGRQGRRLLDGAGRHGAVYADGRSRRRGHQDRGAGNRRQFARLDRPAGHAEHLFRDQQSRREECHAESEDRRKAARSCSKLVAQADIFGQNFRPGAAEKNGFGYEELRKVNPRLVYVSVSGYGPKGPHAHLPGTDSMAQALGGIAEAYSTPGQPMKTGIVSVADETCAILAFGGALAALTHARATGIGQKVDCSLLGGQIRLMGWTLTTAMWRNRNPVTGQARITGTPSAPASAPASTTATASRWCSSSTARAVERGDDRARLLRGAGTRPASAISAS